MCLEQGYDTNTLYMYRNLLFCTDEHIVGYIIIYAYVVFDCCIIPYTDAPHTVPVPHPPPQVSAPKVSAPKASPPPPPPSVGKPKLKKQRRISPPSEIPYGVLDTLQYHTPPKVQITERDLDSIMLCAHDLMLPDFPTLHTRMLLGAWEAGLDGVSEEAAKLLMLSLQVSDSRDAI